MVRCPTCAAPCPDAYNYCVSCGSDLGPVSARLAADPMVGLTLPGGYRVTHMVGVGGMGRVYCAEQVALGRTVAVKVVHPELAGDELAAARFLNEARAASRLSHPNSVAIFDFGRTVEGHAYIVMEFLRGRDLGRVSQDEGPLPLPRVVHVLKQTLAALGEAHALGIVHRDVKPDNIVLEPLHSGLDFVKVVDFGLAKLLNDDAIPLGPSQSRPGLVCGTPEYMSPEQGRGDRLDGRSDLYSVGIVLFELLTGRLPFVGDTQTRTLQLQLSEPPPDPRDAAPDRFVPPAFADLTLRALAKARTDRPQSASEFADALDDALSRTDSRGLDAGPVTAIRCGTCGRLMPIGQRFCGECGSHVSSRPPPPPPASSPRRAGHALGHGSPVPASSPPGRGPRPMTLISRADALAWLEQRRSDATSMPAAAHIVGEPGMGKTRLLAEIASSWSSRGDLVVMVGPDPAWAKVGDAALRAAIHALALTTGTVDNEAWAAANRDARAGLRALFAPSPPVLQAEGRRGALSEALRWSLQRAEARAGAGRVVLLIDDLDFIDGTSRNAFADVLSEPAPVPVLVVAAYSPGARPVADPVAGEAWRLSPLPYESFASSLPPRFVPSGSSLTPLHVEQLVAWAQETAELPPEHLAALISRRMDRLGLHARNTLHALSVWGDGATLDLLARMLPSAVDVITGIEALERVRMVTVDTAGIRISHPLLRRVAFSAIPVGRKRELFAHCADLRPDAPLEVRAKQAMHGGSAFEALALLDALAARRAAHGDSLGSVSSLRHALDLARRELHRGELDDPATAMLVFSRKLAEALVVSHRWQDADGVLREALGSAPPNSGHRAHLLGVMAHVAHARRHPGEARRYLDEAMRVARQSDARGLMPLLEHLDKTIAVA